jgi:hypothetical protein
MEGSSREDPNWRRSERMKYKLEEALKYGVFWVVTPCGSCKNRRFGGTWRLLHPTYAAKKYQ